jgi:hypothetical protein
VFDPYRVPEQDLEGFRAHATRREAELAASPLGPPAVPSFWHGTSDPLLQRIVRIYELAMSLAFDQAMLWPEAEARVVSEIADRALEARTLLGARDVTQRQTIGDFSLGRCMAATLDARGDPYYQGDPCRFYGRISVQREGSDPLVLCLRHARFAGNHGKVAVAGMDDWIDLTPEQRAAFAEMRPLQQWKHRP